MSKEQIIDDKNETRVAQRTTADQTDVHSNMVKSKEQVRVPHDTH